MALCWGWAVVPIPPLTKYGPKISYCISSSLSFFPLENRDDHCKTHSSIVQGWSEKMSTKCFVKSQKHNKHSMTISNIYHYYYLLLSAAAAAWDFLQKVHPELQTIHRPSLEIVLFLGWKFSLFSKLYWILSKLSKIRYGKQSTQQLLAHEFLKLSIEREKWWAVNNVSNVKILIP